MHRPSAEFNRRGDRERSKGIDMLKIQSKNKTMTQELEEFRKKAIRNQGHLIEALRQNEYLQDKLNRREEVHRAEVADL